MPWGRMDDKFHRNRKVRALRRARGGREALGTWVFWWSWCLDDPELSGVVPAEELDAGEQRAALLLVEAGLWNPVEGGYAFNDFADYNPSRDEIEAKRKADRERVASKRSASRAHVACDTPATPTRVASTRDPVPTQPIPESATHSPACAPEAPSASRDPSPSRPSPQAVHDELLSFADVQETFSRLRQAHCGATFKPSQRDYERVNQVRDAANGSGTTRTERETALNIAIRGYLASSDSWPSERSWPISGLNDFGRCLAAGRRLPQERPAAPDTPRSRLEAERRRIVALRGSGAWTQKSHDEQRVAVERLEQIERELAEMRRAS